MKSTQIYIEIAQLLAKQFAGKLSDKEKTQLMLLEKEEDKKEILLSVREKGLDFNRLERYRTFNLDEARKKVAWRIRFRQKNKKRNFMKIFRYAVAIALPLALAAYMVYFADIPQFNTQRQALVEIKPGETKAQLFLSDGRIVDLEKTQNEKIQETDGSIIEKDLDGLSYLSSLQADKLELMVENVVVTPIGGEYQLTLSDGTKVWMNSKSEIRYPVRFSGNTRKVKISGEVYFEVTKDAERPFLVDVNDIEIKVLGTQFNIMAYPEERNIQTTLVEGAVRIMAHGLSGKIRSADLSPGSQAEYDRFSKSVEIKEVDIERFIAWKNGKFVFEKESLNDIMRKLERWYNIKVFFQSNDLKNKRFSARIDRYGNINDILNKIEQTTNICFEIKNNVVQIKKK